MLCSYTPHPFPVFPYLLPVYQRLAVKYHEINGDYAALMHTLIISSQATSKNIAFSVINLPNYHLQLMICKYFNEVFISF